MATETPSQTELPSRNDRWKAVLPIATVVLATIAWVLFCRANLIPVPLCFIVAVIINVFGVKLVAMLCSFATPMLQRLWGGETPRAKRGRFVAVSESDWDELDDETWLRTEPGRIGVVMETSPETMPGMWMGTLISLILGSVFTWAGFVGVFSVLPECLQSFTKFFVLLVMILFLLAGLGMLCLLLPGLMVSKTVTRAWVEGDEFKLEQKVYRFGIPMMRRRRAPRGQVRAKISFYSDPKWDDSWTYCVRLDFAGKDLKFIKHTSAPRGDGWPVIKAAASATAAKLEAAGLFSEIIVIKE